MTQELIEKKIEDKLDEFIEIFEPEKTVANITIRDFQVLVEKIAENTYNIREIFFFIGYIFGILNGSQIDRHQLDNDKIKTMINILDNSIM